MLLQERREKCLLCSRIDPNLVFKTAKALIEDVELARKIAMEARKIIRDAYYTAAPKLCGRSPRSLIAAALYVAGILNNVHLTQRDLAIQLRLSEPSIRNNYKVLLSVLPDIKKRFEEACGRTGEQKRRVRYLDLDERLLKLLSIVKEIRTDYIPLMLRRYGLLRENETVRKSDLLDSFYRLSIKGVYIAVRMDGCVSPEGNCPCNLARFSISQYSSPCIPLIIYREG